MRAMPGENAIKYLENKLPMWSKMVTALITIGMFLFGAVNIGGSIMEVKPDIHELQEFKDETEPLLEFLVCRAFEIDAGEETGACVFLLRDTGFFEEFQRRGIIPENN